MKRILEWFGFKRETPTNIQDCTSRTIEDVARLNYISPEQVKRIKTEFGIDENDTLTASCSVLNAIREEMNKPDVDYLADRLRPNTKEKYLCSGVSADEVIFGTILGDIIGSKYEFADETYKHSKREPLPPRNSHFTDDSVLSVATRNAILDNHYNPDFRKHYIDAYNKYPTVGYGPTFIDWAVMEKEVGYNSIANGTVMRLSFIPAYYKDIDDVIKHTISSAMVTHNHVEAVKGAVVWSVCIWMALHDYNKEELKEYVNKHYLYNKEDLPYILDVHPPFPLDKKLKNLKHDWSDISRNTLFANIAVPYAFKCFYETSSYEECMREILSRTGDIDTICAVAGGLCVAYYGKTGLQNEEIIEKVNGLEALITNYKI